MIDLKFLQENPDVVRKNIERRGKDVDIDAILKMADDRVRSIRAVEDLRSKINENAKGIQSAGETAREEMIKEGRELKAQLKDLESDLTETEAEFNRGLRQIPNILNEKVKTGRDDAENELLREVGEIPQFDFEVKDHLDLGLDLGLIDMERAAKVSGSRFVYLKGELALLQFALVQYALSVLVPEGFTPVIPPHIVSVEAMGMMGYLDHGGEEEIYHLRSDDAVLIGTSEQAIGPMHMNEILDLDALPLRYVGVSPCYRREAGSYGKDMRGILRLHQFNKVEMFSFTTQEDSEKEHEYLLSLEERLMQGLKLPYRVMRLCSGDIGAPSAMTYDIEVWLPGQNKYREVTSTSNTTDFQTRRLKTRYKTKDGKNLFAHALNGTAFSDRPLIAILENYQQSDGSVEIPDILRPWVGKDKIEAKK